ncbi:MAG: HlyD family secretion protein [Leptolyngbya sp. BL-A-14]
MPNSADSSILREVDSRDFLPAISRWSRLGGVVLVGACTTLIALAAMMPYRVTVKAAGTVRPDGELRVVQASVDGAIKQIAVKENQRLDSGEMIVRLDDSSLQSRKSQLQTALQRGRLQLEQLEAQISQLHLQLMAEEGVMDRSIAIARADLSDHKKTFQEKQIDTKSELQEAEASLEIAILQQKRWKAAVAAGAIAQTEVEQKEQAVKVAEARWERAKAASFPSDASITMAEFRLAQEKVKGLAKVASLQQEKAVLEQHRLELQTQGDQRQKELQQLDVELRKTIITAPTTGTLLKLQVRNVGQMLRVGDTVANISPRQTPLIVKARIGVQDIGKVKLGQLVIMRVSAYTYTDYGTLKGTVVAVSPDAIAPAHDATASLTSDSAAAASYEITIQPETIFLQRGTQPYPIQSGMEVVANIVSKEETVLTFILRKARLLTDL